MLSGPYTYRVSGDANADGVFSIFTGGENDLVYVPRDSADISLSDPGSWEALDSLIRSQRCLREQRGRIMRRNSCRDHWLTQLNVRLSKAFPAARGHSLELIADLFNTLSFIDRNWGHSAQSGATGLELIGYDEVNGRGIYKVLEVNPDEVRVKATRWRVQLGARYRF
jgi:hypothetical protein